MVTHQSLRTSRVRRLHARFLDFNERFPTTFHLSVTSDNDDVIGLLNRYDAAEQDIWDAVIDGLDRPYRIIGSGEQLGTPKGFLWFSSTWWVGRYYRPYYNEDDPHYKTDMVHFEQFGTESLATVMPDMNWFLDYVHQDEVEGRNHRWLEILYQFFEVKSQTVHFSLPESMKTTAFESADVRVACLPYNVFLASAIALERLETADWQFRPEQYESHQGTAAAKTRPLPKGTGERLSASEQRIVDTIRSAGHRLTTTEIISALERDFGPTSEGTTKQSLAVLVRRELLTNRQDTTPKGYGLPDWS